MPVRDFKGHLVCIIYKDTGLVETKKGSAGSKTIVPVGGSIKITRGGVVTVLYRESVNKYLISTYECPKDVNSYFLLIA